MGESSEREPIHYLGTMNTGEVEPWFLNLAARASGVSKGAESFFFLAAAFAAILILKLARATSSGSGGGAS